MKYIKLHLQAPAKPAPGQPCNGCGVCCASQPCPVGIFVLLQRQGRCRALRWQAEQSRYACGMALCPGEYLPWLPAQLEAWAARIFRRSIAAGLGCDSDIEVDGNESPV